MSTSTVLSSVESLPPTASVEGLPRVPEHTAEEQGKAGLEEKDGKNKFCLFVWFDFLRPINNISVKQGRVFQGWTSTKLG